MHFITDRGRSGDRFSFWSRGRLSVKDLNESSNFLLLPRESWIFLSTRNKRGLNGWEKAAIQSGIMASEDDDEDDRARYEGGR